MPPRHMDLFRDSGNLAIPFHTLQALLLRHCSAGTAQEREGVDPWRLFSSSSSFVIAPGKSLLNQEGDCLSSRPVLGRKQEGIERERKKGGKERTQQHYFG